MVRKGNSLSQSVPRLRSTAALSRLEVLKERREQRRHLNWRENPGGTRGNMPQRSPFPDPCPDFIFLVASDSSSVRASEFTSEHDDGTRPSHGCPSVFGAETHAVTGLCPALLRVLHSGAHVRNVLHEAVFGNQRASHPASPEMAPLPRVA